MAHARIWTLLAIVVAGTFHAPGAEVAVPFEAQTSAGFGELTDLGPLPAGAGADLILTRQLATLFDGIDFASADSESIARTVVRTVVEGAVIELTIIE